MSEHPTPACRGSLAPAGEHSGALAVKVSGFRHTHHPIAAAAHVQRLVGLDDGDVVFLFGERISLGVRIGNGWLVVCECDDGGGGHCVTEGDRLYTRKH